jgi:hypothetical protein
MQGSLGIKLAVYVWIGYAGLGTQTDLLLDLVLNSSFLV